MTLKLDFYLCVFGGSFLMCINLHFSTLVNKMTDESQFLSPIKTFCNASQVDLNTILLNNLVDFQSCQIPQIFMSVTYVGREKGTILH